MPDGFGKRPIAREQVPVVDGVERLDRSAHIGRKRRGVRSIGLEQDVAGERLGKRRAAGRKRRVIGGGAAIEGFGESEHRLRHREVADAHFAQVVVHVAAEVIEQRLRQRGALCGDAAGAAKPATDAATPCQNGR